MSEQYADWRAGALRYKGADGVWVVTEPQNAMYSTASMVATEYWDTEEKTWRPIFDDGAHSK